MFLCHDLMGGQKNIIFHPLIQNLRVVLFDQLFANIEASKMVAARV